MFVNLGHCDLFIFVRVCFLLGPDVQNWQNITFNKGKYMWVNVTYLLAVVCKATTRCLQRLAGSI